MQPPAQACILFSKPPTKGNELINKSKRGNVLRYHVGSWSFPALLEAIHDAIIHTRLIRLQARDEAARLIVPGAPEVSNVFGTNEIFAVALFSSFFLRLLSLPP